MIIGRSVRYWYDTLAVGRFSEIEWDGGILDGKYGRIGRAFLAKICRYVGAEAQQAVHDEIERGGANAGLAVWVRMVFDDARRLADGTSSTRSTSDLNRRSAAHSGARTRGRQEVISRNPPALCRIAGTSFRP